MNYMCEWSAPTFGDYLANYWTAPKLWKLHSLLKSISILLYIASACYLKGQVYHVKYLFSSGWMVKCHAAWRERRFCSHVLSHKGQSVVLNARGTSVSHVKIHLIQSTNSFRLDIQICRYNYLQVINGAQKLHFDCQRETFKEIYFLDEWQNLKWFWNCCYFKK